MAARSPKAPTPRSPPIRRSRSPTWARSRRVMAALLRIESISVGYDRADVLRDVSLAVEGGSIPCILGSTGSGKSTLIRAVLGLTAPRGGRIVSDGADIAGLPTHAIVARGVACIPEGRRVFPKLTVAENLRLGAYRETREATIRSRMDKVFAIFPRLAERAGQLAGTMSGGEQAMISIGRRLMPGPRLLLVEERARAGAARGSAPALFRRSPPSPLRGNSSLYARRVRALPAARCAPSNRSERQTKQSHSRHRPPINPK